jgi:glutaredoxin
MEFPLPKANNFTIYSKSGCLNCNNVKKLFKDRQISYTIIDCDEFLFDDKDNFLNFIKEIAGLECKIFPMVFYGKRFIGGFLETMSYLDKMLDFDSEF